MAKWGEGDPRWIVEERPDSTNVNNWHWTEINAEEWSKEKLKSLYEGLVLKDTFGTVTLISITKCEGDASASNRKGKLIFFYEWEIKINWEAKLLSDPDKEIKGNLSFNITDEYASHEIYTTVFVENGNDEGDQVRTFLRVGGLPEIQTKTEEYVKALNEKYSKGLILPTKSLPDDKAPTIMPLSNVTTKAFKEALQLSDKSPKKTATQLCKVTLSEEFKCAAEELYNVLTVPELVSAFTRSKTDFVAEVGGKFSLLNGGITGTFEVLEKPYKIRQKWRRKEWPADIVSDVTITISQGDGVTNLNLLQTGVPVAEVDTVKQGWRVYYWDAIRRIFGFGAFLM